MRGKTALMSVSSIDHLLSSSFKQKLERVVYPSMFGRHGIARHAFVWHDVSAIEAALRPAWIHCAVAIGSPRRRNDRALPLAGRQPSRRQVQGPAESSLQSGSIWFSWQFLPLILNRSTEKSPPSGGLAWR